MNFDRSIIDHHDNSQAVHSMRRKQVTLLLKKWNSLDDDGDDPEVTHHSIILDALDEMDLMEVDDDPNANQTDPDDDELDEFKTLDATTGPGEPPKIPTPPPT